MKKDFLSIKDLSLDEIKGIFELTKKLKAGPGAYSKVLAGRTLALIFQKPSNRTRVSFEVGMYQLGGYSIYLGPSEIGLGKREPVRDVARTLERYVSAMAARTFLHADIVELSKYSKRPVINALSDLSHPCQAMADIFTVFEYKNKLKGLKLAYIGDGNNVLNSLMYLCAKVGIDVSAAIPAGYEPADYVIEESKLFAKKTGASIEIVRKPSEAVKSADILYTDVWVSMGQEEGAKKRLKDFKGFQINGSLLKLAKKDAIVMHCLPAHRGEEITDDVMESGRSVVFDEAENRLHAQKAILIKLLNA